MKDQNCCDRLHQENIYRIDKGDIPPLHEKQAGCDHKKDIQRPHDTDIHRPRPKIIHRPHERDIDRHSHRDPISETRFQKMKLSIVSTVRPRWNLTTKNVPHVTGPRSGNTGNARHVGGLGERQRSDVKRGKEAGSSVRDSVPRLPGFCSLQRSETNAMYWPSESQSWRGRSTNPRIISASWRIWRSLRELEILAKRKKSCCWSGGTDRSAV